MEIITISPEEMMRQAGLTAHDYMSKAVQAIDQQFHTGYAEEHPELVGQFIAACAIDFATTSFVKVAAEFYDLLLSLQYRR